MYSDNGLIVDVPQVLKVVTEADVFGVGFRLFGERLFVDTRTNAIDGPFIAMVEPLSNVQERVLWLSRRRPRFGTPQRFAFFFWPNSVRFFEESGVWDAIRARVVAGGDPAAIRDADRALADLRRRERDAVRAAITGEGHRSLWERQSYRPSR
jgi:hypothetical protein